MLRNTAASSLGPSRVFQVSFIFMFGDSGFAPALPSNTRKYEDIRRH